MSVEQDISIEEWKDLCENLSDKAKQKLANWIIHSCINPKNYHRE